MQFRAYMRDYGLVLWMGATCPGCGGIVRYGLNCPANTGLYRLGFIPEE